MLLPRGRLAPGAGGDHLHRPVQRLDGAQRRTHGPGGRPAPEPGGYRPDVDVRIAWGAQRDDVGFLRQLSGPIRTEWNTLSSRREATPLLLDAFYRGALVHRTTYLWGDGARFPYPRPRELRGHTRLVASRRESHLVGLVEEISEGSTEAYWQRVEQVGFLLVDDELEDPNR